MYIIYIFYAIELMIVKNIKRKVQTKYKLFLIIVDFSSTYKMFQLKLKIHIL